LALATTLSATLNAVLLYRGLKDQQVFKLSNVTKVFIGKLIFAACCMAVVVNYLSPSFDIWLTMGFVEQLTKLIAYISVGMVTYFAVLYVIGVRLKDFKVKEDNSIESATSAGL
jgi:putative peptidoglycan lipid II flippase